MNLSATNLVPVFEQLLAGVSGVSHIFADGDEIGVKGCSGGVIYFDVPSHLIRWKYYDAYGRKGFGIEGIDEEKWKSVVIEVVRRYFDK